MTGRILWVKPFDRANHNPNTAGARGECGWHGQTEQRLACAEPPYASIKFEYADYSPVQSACARALREISREHGFPIPPDQP